MDSSSNTAYRDAAKAGAYVGAEYLSAVQQNAGGQVRPSRMQAAAVSATDGLLSFNHDNYEALVRSGRVLATAAQEMRHDLAAATQSSLDDANKAMAAFASARSIKDLMDVQASLFRTAMERTLARSVQMTNNSFELTQQALQPISARITAVAKGFTPPG